MKIERSQSKTLLKCGSHSRLLGLPSTRPTCNVPGLWPHVRDIEGKDRRDPDQGPQGRIKTRLSVLPMPVSGPQAPEVWKQCSRVWWTKCRMHGYSISEEFVYVGLRRSQRRLFCFSVRACWSWSFAFW